MIRIGSQSSIAPKRRRWPIPRSTSSGARKDASIRVALELLKQGEVQGVVSAGNSGATMALAVVVLGKLPGVERPALGAILPGPINRPC